MGLAGAPPMTASDAEKPEPNFESFEAEMW
jgi:hypothetical protein